MPGAFFASLFSWNVNSYLKANFLFPLEKEKAEEYQDQAQNEKRAHNHIKNGAEVGIFDPVHQVDDDEAEQKRKQDRAQHRPDQRNMASGDPLQKGLDDVR